MEDKNTVYMQAVNLSKSFGHVNALSGVCLEAHLGQILAIVGDNGAGKSTFIKVLSGVIAPDSGHIVLNGKSYERLSPRMARQCGVSTVFQDLSLVNTMNTWENIFLGHEYRCGGFMKEKKMRGETADLLAQLEIRMPDLDSPVGLLSGGQRQCVAVAKAIHQGGKLIVFDEPTAAMGIKETRAVQRLLVKLAKEGYGVIVVSHNIQQVIQISQRLCVMRQGAILTVMDTAAVDSEKIISMIINGMEQN